MNCAPSRMQARAVSGSSTVPAPMRMSGRSATRRRMTCRAPGTVMVTSRTLTPPAATAVARAMALSTDSARRTGTSPVSCKEFNTAALSMVLPFSLRYHCGSYGGLGIRSNGKRVERRRCAALPRECGVVVKRSKDSSECWRALSCVRSAQHYRLGFFEILNKAMQHDDA